LIAINVWGLVVGALISRALNTEEYYEEEEQI
jgi:hypothetical protein